MASRNAIYAQIRSNLSTNTRILLRLLKRIVLSLPLLLFGEQRWLIVRAFTLTYWLESRYVNLAYDGNVRGKPPTKCIL